MYHIRVLTKMIYFLLSIYWIVFNPISTGNFMYSKQNGGPTPPLLSNQMCIIGWLEKGYSKGFKTSILYSHFYQNFALHQEYCTDVAYPLLWWKTNLCWCLSWVFYSEKFQIIAENLIIYFWRAVTLSYIDQSFARNG